MTIPLKGSRQVVVEGTPYRWRVRHKPTYYQALTWSGLVVAVERADVKGALLIVKTDRPHPSNWMEVKSKGVVPSEVTNFICDALRLGWNPSEPGRPFTMEVKDKTA